MDYTQFLHKNRISFDVNQLIVCEHTTFVRENSPFVDAGQKKQIWGYLDKKREIQENTYHLPLTR
jgi:hypothetical protein